MRNIAYIDGQNLHLGTTKRDPVWWVDLARLRVYLEKKYHVDRAYYYLGYVQDDEPYQRLYEEVQTSGFVLVFREHNSAMKGTKKGNVDSDIIFSIMKRMYYREKFEKIVLVSGDGDYKQLVDFLIEENKFEKILFPKQRYASSLYKQITRKYFDDLSKSDIKEKIEKRKGGLR
ncbi:NYN domain-containing protein [Patescibacteria group bacterium]|jgi:uncharacterized LabA/DUF88 family protein|nr:NYN domain-containing protein [Patescibacteria group bacterium]